MPNLKTEAICLFLIAFGIRLGFVLTLENRLYWPDEIAFDNIALGILNGEGYRADPFRANPVLPFFLAILYKLFGYSYIAPRIFQSFIGALTTCIVFAVSWRLFNRSVAFMAGLWVALYPPLIYVSGVFYVSCLETFLIAASVYLFHLSTQYKDSYYFIVLFLSGIALGIATLCRPLSLVLLPFAVGFVLLSREGNTVRRIVCALTLVIATFLTILPWTLRNYDVYGRVLLVSTGTGLFLWKGNNELAQGDTHDRYLEPGAGEVWTTRLRELAPDRRRELTQKYDDVRRELEKIDNIDQDRYLQKIALSFIVQYPVRSLELFARKIKNLYSPFTEVRPENEYTINKGERAAVSIIFYPTLLLGLFGAFLTLKEWRNYLVLYLPIVSLTVAYGVLTAATRFRIPVEPYIIIFAAHGTAVIWDFIAQFLCSRSSANNETTSQT
jgi:4-amino-4-deoxy-L-arabinose transferase-like glycosyltransferase